MKAARRMSVLYEKDFYAWARETARLLRSRRFEELDLEDLVREVEDLGKRERRELESRLATLMEHLLFLAYLRTSEEEGWGWIATAAQQRRELALLLEDNPSLRPFVLPAARRQYAGASKQLLRKGREFRRLLAEEELPPVLPWTDAELLTEDLFLCREELERRRGYPPEGAESGSER